mmetsp:Transcript_10745/g.15158  ORF Transcript_10745/g.15158 Transcript_10745/m.15158 type:complete len:370 (+) Transcript_10745:108-1217(+)|eukprot:CAMPEP_0184865652 /NCGR_PEP_ID=MMETSP0580-20130426/18768_1 /TAXON_ID=1118495 /ORGANISM="Dactyliosolen fragilissimus" /LENGTH=369 /DNA_ID=CAMNT_0027364939 /DNA_START=41 /DNA_END=1150 /DNA_ORIENTATION=+
MLPVEHNNALNEPGGSLMARSGSGGGLLHEREVVRSAGRDAISAFLDSHTCSSVLRASGKVVVFDTRIPIQLAFYALVEHDMQSAPLWDPSSCQFVGLLTVTDFIDVLRYYRETKKDVSTLATRSIADILSDQSILSTVLIRHVPRRGIEGSFNNVVPNMVNHHHSFLSADTNTTLKHACHLLHTHSLDFLPVIIPDDMRVLATITYTTILEHLVTHFREQRRLFDDTVYDLNIGTYNENVVTVSHTQSLAEVLHTLHINGLSAVPVIDENDKIRGVYSRSDITFLATASDAEDAVANLDMSLKHLMSQTRSDVTTPDALHTCSTKQTLQSIFEYFAQWKFNRLIVIDEEDRVQGVVSARDLVAYFLAQ